MVQKNLPKHVAIIMDGNRRWAARKGLPAMAGHKVVVDKRVEELIEKAGEMGIPYITFWAWSSENWRRPEEEVKGVMKLFRWALERKANKMIERGARLRVIGDWRAFEGDIAKGIEEMIEKSKDNDKINVTFALNYGGRDEILRAINQLFEERGASYESRVTIEAKDLEAHLDTAGMPDPDLIIRTGGAQRLSGFMLWQSEYSEFYFTEEMMPEFDGEKFGAAVKEYMKRGRRFGGGGFADYAKA